MQNNKTKDSYKNDKVTQKQQLTAKEPQEPQQEPVTEQNPDKEAEEKNNSNKTITFDNFINDNSISILKTDHKLIVNLLIVLSKRGAFNIDEYKVIGDLYERLKKLL